MKVWLSYEEGCCWGEKKWGDLLYFRGCFEGRVRVACRLLYSIFRVGRGLLYFIDSSYSTIYNNYFLRAR